MKLKYLLVAMFIVMLLFAVSCKKKEAEEVVVQEVVEEPKPGELVVKEEAPEEVEKCGTETVLTYQKCKDLGDNKIAVSFINSGRGEIEGVWFYVISESGETGYEEVKEIIPVKEVKTYEVDLSKWISKLGSVAKIEVGPEDIVDGVSKVCVNQKQVFVPSKNCK